MLSTTANIPIGTSSSAGYLFLNQLYKRRGSFSLRQKAGGARKTKLLLAPAALEEAASSQRLGGIGRRSSPAPFLHARQQGRATILTPRRLGAVHSPLSRSTAGLQNNKSCSSENRPRQP